MCAHRVCVHDQLGRRFWGDLAGGGRVQAVEDGTALAAFLAPRLQPALLKVRYALAHRVLQLENLHSIAQVFRLDDLARERLGIIGTAVVDGQNLPGLALLTAEEPLELFYLHAHKVLSIRMVCLLLDPVLLAVHGEDADHVQRATIFHLQFALGRAHRRDEYGRSGALAGAVTVAGVLEVLQWQARLDDRSCNLEDLEGLGLIREVASERKAFTQLGK